MEDIHELDNVIENAVTEWVILNTDNFDFDIKDKIDICIKDGVIIADVILSFFTEKEPDFSKINKGASKNKVIEFGLGKIDDGNYELLTPYEITITVKIDINKLIDIFL